MSESLSDFGLRVARWHKIPDTVVASADQTQAIHSAAKTYSTRAPLERTVELTPNADNEWTLTAAITGYADGWQVVGVLYEWGTGNLIPVSDNDWRVLRRGSTDYLRVPCLPENTDGIWVEYTQPHVIGATSGDTTIPVLDLDAVAKLAAAECCGIAAASQSDEKGSTINANVVDYGGIPVNWSQRKSELTAAYEKHMDARYTHGNGFVNWNSRLSSGRRTMFHEER